MSERGTFVVDRGLFGHPAFADEPFTEREAWLWLIAQAAFKPHERRIGRFRVSLARGQMAAATRFMAKAWKWSEASVRRFLDRLAGEQMIVTSRDADLTQITICNYEAYQSDPKNPDAEVTQTRRKEEETEERKKEPTDSARAREAMGVSQDAQKAADQFLHAIGINPAAPELHGMSGAPWSIAAWMHGGWTAQQITAEGARIAGERRARGQELPGLKYWNAVFSKPPPQPELPLLRVIVNGGAGHETVARDRREPWQRRRDERHAARAEFKAGIAAAERALHRSEQGGG
jgi:hypothetical protein